MTKITVHNRRKERVLVYLKKSEFLEEKKNPQQHHLIAICIFRQKIGIGLAVCFSFWRTLHMQQVSPNLYYTHWVKILKKSANYLEAYLVSFDKYNICQSLLLPWPKQVF